MKRAIWILTAATGTLVGGAGAIACGGNSERSGNHSDSGHSGDHGDASSATHAEEASGHAHDRAMLHGGQVAMTEHHHFETVFAPEGIRVYRYTGAQVPMRVGGTQGTATLRFRDGTRKEIPLQRREPKMGEATAYFCPAHPAATQMEPGICKQCGTMQLMAQDYLFGSIDLSGIQAGAAKATVHLEGMEGEELDATFTESVALSDSEPSAAEHAEGAHGEEHSH